MGCAISSVAYGPNKEIASQSLIASLGVYGYEIMKFESTDFVWIYRYGKYKFVYAYIRTGGVNSNIVRAHIERVSDF